MFSISSYWGGAFNNITKMKNICFTYNTFEIANNESLVNTQFYRGLPSHSTSVLYTIYVLRYRTTVKLCNVFRWETLTLISSCGKTFHVKLSISSLTCWFTNQKRGWVYDKLLLIHGFKYWNSQELKSVNNTKSQQSDWEPTTLDWSKISNIVYHIHVT